jgi:hypothetical protein
MIPSNNPESGRVNIVLQKGERPPQRGNGSGQMLLSDRLATHGLRHGGDFPARFRLLREPATSRFSSPESRQTRLAWYARRMAPTTVRTPIGTPSDTGARPTCTRSNTRLPMQNINVFETRTAIPQRNRRAEDPEPTARNPSPR